MRGSLTRSFVIYGLRWPMWTSPTCSRAYSPFKRVYCPALACNSSRLSWSSSVQMRANLASRFRTMDPALVCRMLRKPPWVFLEKVAWISRTQERLGAHALPAFRPRASTS